jgi:hypothetical protein
MIFVRSRRVPNRSTTAFSIAITGPEVIGTQIAFTDADRAAAGLAAR